MNDMKQTYAVNKLKMLGNELVISIEGEDVWLCDDDTFDSVVSSHRAYQVFAQAVAWMEHGDVVLVDLLVTFDGKTVWGVDVR
jgi:hypothetical protein